MRGWVRLGPRASASSCSWVLTAVPAPRGTSPEPQHPEGCRWEHWEKLPGSRTEPARSSASPGAAAQLSESACSTWAFKDEEECRVTPGAPMSVSQHSNPHAHRSRLAASTACGVVSAGREARTGRRSARPCLEAGRGAHVRPRAEPGGQRGTDLVAAG